MKLLKIFLLTLLVFRYQANCFGQIPEGYYDDAEGLTGEELKAALHNIIDDHVEFSYDALRDYLLKETDEDPENSDNVILFYCGRSRAKSAFGSGSDNWNREHVWAKSHGDFGTSPPAGTDCHHMKPTDVNVNSIRGNLDFDNGGTALTEAPDCKVDADSFEPRDADKGDAARMIFYMAVRYEGDNGEPDLEVVDEVNTYPAPEHGKLSALLQWHELDPPGSFEMNRNEVIYSYQQNRNPFIDHPEYVELIWGDPSQVSGFDIIRTAVYPNPVSSELNIEYSKNVSLSISLFYLDGNKMMTARLAPGKSKIELSHLPDGLYVVLLTDIHGRIIKQYKINKISP